MAFNHIELQVDEEDDVLPKDDYRGTKEINEKTIHRCDYSLLGRKYTAESSRKDTGKA